MLNQNWQLTPISNVIRRTPDVEISLRDWRLLSQQNIEHLWLYNTHT